MRPRFEMKPARLKTWAELEQRGFRLYEIACELGCSIHTLIRHKRRTGAIDPIKARAGRIGMASRYSREVSP